MASDHTRLSRDLRQHLLAEANYRAAACCTTCGSNVTGNCTLYHVRVQSTKTCDQHTFKEAPE